MADPKIPAGSCNLANNQKDWTYGKVTQFTTSGRGDNANFQVQIQQANGKVTAVDVSKTTGVPAEGFSGKVYFGADLYESTAPDNRNRKPAAGEYGFEHLQVKNFEEFYTGEGELEVQRMYDAVTPGTQDSVDAIRVINAAQRFVDGGGQPCDKALYEVVENFPEGAKNNPYDAK